MKDLIPGNSNNSKISLLIITYNLYLRSLCPLRRKKALIRKTRVVIKEEINLSFINIMAIMLIKHIKHSFLRNKVLLLNSNNRCSNLIINKNLIIQGEAIPHINTLNLKQQDPTLP